MANEELEQRKLIGEDGRLKGTKFGVYEELNIGSTSAKDLASKGLDVVLPDTVDYPFQKYKAPTKPASCKPDIVYISRIDGKLKPIAVKEQKAKKKRKGVNNVLSAAEQAFYAAKTLGVSYAVIESEDGYLYIDVNETFKKKEIVYFNEERDWSPAVLEGLESGQPTAAQDPKPLAEKIWQLIWHATKEDPKECLLTFVEIFVLKFLSDNLPAEMLPQSKSFYELIADPQDFNKRHGESQIEYYISKIRPHIKTLFPDNTAAEEDGLPEIFGLKTIISKTSILNGFAFLKSSTTTLTEFDRVFREILDEFLKFGPLTNIDSEFKLRLYETFLKRSARQQKLGQFFTPRNVVRPIIKMARLSKLKEGAVVLDPAAGVGGFILEPMLFDDALPENLQFKNGEPRRKIKTIGVDVDDDLHLLAKANMLIHLVEAVRDRSTTIKALNRAMAEHFVLMNNNQTLGSLEFPPQASVDVILTNPPYVTDGSKAYRKALTELPKPDENGKIKQIDLEDYYDGSGLGVESLFLRYISGALKPGGKAFIIVPLGLLNRTDQGPKDKILKECNILASIQLPRNTFFNTAQKTYILVLEKRHTASDDRPKVMAAIARTIGESLDWRRTPQPKLNDLAAIADCFVDWIDAKLPTDRDDVIKMAEANEFIRFVEANEFSGSKRWDVPRLWSDEELVKLGERDEVIPKSDFLDEARTRITDLLKELDEARKELHKLMELPTKTVKLSNASLFEVYSGDRVTTADVQKNPGIIPVYSCFKSEEIVKGKASAKWLRSIGVRIQKPNFVTINANGASVGKVYVRKNRCMITDDVIAVRPKQGKEGEPWIDIRYLAFRLREVVAQGGFLYEAKLFQARVKELEVSLPIKDDESWDLEAQRSVADIEARVDGIVKKLRDLGDWSGSARLY